MSGPDVTQSAVLSAHALHLWRGEHHLLRGVSFTLSSGELLQITGPNGVGKTSLLRLVAGLMPAESGEVHWKNTRIDQNMSEYHGDLAYLGHANALKTDLTAVENLYFCSAVRRDVTQHDCIQVLNTLNIPQCAALPVKALSAGQRRRVALARVLLSGAQLWILDEPITNLDAAGIQLVEQLMAEQLSRGGMILTAAHQSLLASHPGVRNLSLQ